MGTYIKQLYINGYKRFKNFYVEFQPGLNILIGENSAGKSTVLEAINIVLNQYYFGGSNDNVQQQLNMDNVKEFMNISSPGIDDLPSVEIELELIMENQPENQKFCGLNYEYPYDKKEVRYGVQFKFEFDKEYENEFNDIDFSLQENKSIPLEYYHAIWTTFSGRTYRRIMNPLRSILIDNSINTKDVYGNYARTLYSNKIDEKNQKKISYSFKNALNATLKEKKDYLCIGNNRSFAVDEQKSKFTNLIEVRENDISLRNMGKGEENILKTSLSLDRSSNLNLIMLEEPENHLSYSNTRKQIDKIQGKNSEGKQIIATTHESMILNRLNLSKAIWIKEERGQSLQNLPKEDAMYFERVDNFDILRYVLGSKVVLVEGASEFILLPTIIKRIFGESVDAEKISIISMRGIQYSHFKSLSNIVNKKTLVLTDNDGSQEKIDAINREEFNTSTFKVITPSDIAKFTLEVSLYENNKDLCKKIIKELTSRKLISSKYKDHENLPITLAAMLARKTEFALSLSKKIDNGEEFKTPDYLKEGLEWLVSSN